MFRRSILATKTRHKCFISYHSDDEGEVGDFIDEFDHSRDVFISRGIGASMAEIIESENDDYIKRCIRENYLNDSTVTIVMIGASTWSRKFVDWEIAASLRNTANSRRNGLLAIALPSAGANLLPARFEDNYNSDGTGYADFIEYPSNADELAAAIETSFSKRTTHGHLVNNSRPLRKRN
ncbi:TIR domain-containing protein [Corynebacterium cystitidis]|uniref:TIR domain-containing protein n=1 Tax=Corynebacterium cystitidis TaxID=35757 RepID=UPI00211E7E72|nr:TIR domain-containing protein [Corynebacterium cystitidis]